jgi:hypothetical protein
MRCVSLALVASIAGAAACSKSPSAPSSAPSPRFLQGQTVNAVDGSAAPSIRIQLGDWRSVTTDHEGLFEIELGSGAAQRATIHGDSFVERETTLSGSAGGRTRLSLIPAGFDLVAFDEMVRTTNDRLQRWTFRPELVVLGTVMAYRTGNGSDYTATAEQLSDDEVQLMVQHLSEGLALLTGKTFTSFASVNVERPSSGTRIPVVRHGQIVVGRYTGVVSMVNTIGFGQWAEAPDGTVTGGTMYLDRDFDREDSRRRLLRIHELGHALGYLHVRSRTSIMNPAIGPEPTDFDRAAAIVAFQRPPGNRSPDIDPSPSSRVLATTDGSSSRWMPPVFCR